MAIRVSCRELLTSCLLASIVVVAAASSVEAQTRFKVVTRSAVSDLGGLNIYTIRDEQLSACYLLFVMEQPAASRPDQLAAPAEAPAAPDRKSQDPQKWATRSWNTQTPGEPSGGWEQLAESMRLALVDPATADALAEPVSTKLSDVSERLGRIEQLLKNFGGLQRLAVLPVSCSPAGK